jgi:hypothetical protein
MIKLLAVASLGAAFVCGFVGVVFGQTPYPPLQEPVVTYALPTDSGRPAVLYEGRSAYRMWDPGALYGSDEAAEPTEGAKEPKTGK